MKDLIMSRIDYTMLAIFVIALIFVVILVVGQPAPSQQIEEVSESLLDVEHKAVQHLPEYTFLAALFGFLVFLAIVTQPTPQQSKRPHVVESNRVR